jgi:hypothetical protein
LRVNKRDYKALSAMSMQCTRLDQVKHVVAGLTLGLQLRTNKGNKFLVAILGRTTRTREP